MVMLNKALAETCEEILKNPDLKVIKSMDSNNWKSSMSKIGFSKVRIYFILGPSRTLRLHITMAYVRVLCSRRLSLTKTNLLYTHIYIQLHLYTENHQY